MMVRIVLLLLGLGALGGGGYFGWLHQDQIPQLQAFDPAKPPLELLGAAGAALLGLILVLIGVFMRTTSKEAKAAEAARRAQAIQEADAYYAQRAKDPDRDWRNDGLPPEAPATKPAPPTPASEPAPVAAIAPQATSAAPAPFPAPMPANPIPSTQPVAAPTPPVASAAASAPQQPTSPPRPAPVAMAPPAGDSAAMFPEIRKALADKRLDDADRLLNEQRTRLQNAGDAESLELAELTSLAGEHAAASGRIGGAKWLWRLALQRYASANALGSPSARAVSERLRLSDQ